MQAGIKKMTTIRQRFEDANQLKEYLNKYEFGCPICDGEIEVQKEENFYILVCKECQTLLGEII